MGTLDVKETYIYRSSVATCKSSKCRLQVNIVSVFKIKVTFGHKMRYEIKITFGEISLKLHQTNWNVAINNVDVVVVDELPS